MLKMKKVRSISFTLICLFSVIAFPKISCAKFIQTHLTRVGGVALSPGNEVIMAKYDIISLNRFQYDDIDGDTWGAVKAINPNVEIYLYQIGRESDYDDDNKSLVSLNNIGRWDIELMLLQTPFLTPPACLSPSLPQTSNTFSWHIFSAGNSGSPWKSVLTS